MRRVRATGTVVQEGTCFVTLVADAALDVLARIVVVAIVRLVAARSCAECV